jgi:hypothetical protein
MIFIPHGKIHDVKILDNLLIESRSIYVMDRGYLDFSRLHKIQQSSAFFVTRTKKNIDFKRLYSHAVSKDNGIQCDQTIVLMGLCSKKDYPENLSRLLDLEKGKRLIFLTNNFMLHAQTKTDLYQCRWQLQDAMSCLIVIGSMHCGKIC